MLNVLCSTTQVRCLSATVLLFAICPSLGAQRSTPSTDAAVTPAAPKLKSVELDHQYTIEVPNYFTVHGAQPIPHSSTGGTETLLDGGPSHQISVYLLPYSRYSAFKIPTDEKTGRVKLPVSVDGGPLLTAFFKIRGGLYAYFGWRVNDLTKDCTMNTPCPHWVPPKSRYMTEYAFVVFDPPHIVEFRAVHGGPSENVAALEGDGKLLREVIVPSLR